MKKLVFLFVSIFVLVLTAQNVKAQKDATESAKTSANIISHLSIEKDVDLVFGNIVRSGSSGTVVIAPDGDRTLNDGALPFANSTGDPTAAEFTVTGENNATYSVTVNNTSFDVTKDGSSETMEVNTITTSPASTGSLDENGEQIITVGATLVVGANQAPGLYENDDALEITVAYN